MLERLADLDPDAVERRRRAGHEPTDTPPAGAAVHPIRRTIRYYLSRIAASVMTRAWIRPRLEGRERLPPGPAIYCFNHLSWSDPFMLMATPAVAAAALLLRPEGGGHAASAAGTG